MNVALLQQRLRSRIMDRTQYPEQMSVVTCLTRAADLATGVIAELARGGRLTIADARPPGGRGQADRPRKSPGTGSAGSPRRVSADEKRRRLRDALSGGPLQYGEIQHRAQLTAGECSWLLKSTPGITALGGGRYGLAGQ